MESYSMVTGGVTLANKRNRFPQGGQAAVGVTARRERAQKRHAQALVMEDARAGSPYMFFMPTGTPGGPEEKEIDTYFVPRKKWEIDVESAARRQARRLSLCKNYLDSERLHFIVRVLAQHAVEKKLAEDQFVAALKELGVTNAHFAGKVFHLMAQGSGGLHVDYEMLVGILAEYVCGSDLIESSDGEKRQRWQIVVRSCYDLFDPPDADGRREGYIAVRDLKVQRGLSVQRMEAGDPSQITFAMCKALLDLAARLPSHSHGYRQILELPDIMEEWEKGGPNGGGEPGLVQGFLEEVLRIVLVERYKQTRKLLYR